MVRLRSSCRLNRQDRETIYSFTADSVYEASAEILIEKNRFTSSIADLLTPLIPGSAKDLQNRMEVLQSRPVLERAFAKLETNTEFAEIRRELAARPNLWKSLFHTLGMGKNPSDGAIALKELEERLTVRDLRNTDIIELRTTGGTPREAQLIANAFIQAYLEQDAEIQKQTISSIKTFLEVQLDKTQAQLAQAEEAAVEFQKRAQLELGADGAQKNLIELNKLVLQGRIDLEDKEGMLRAINELLRNVRAELLNKHTNSEELNAVLLELQDKVTQIRKTQQEIADLEIQRENYLNEGNYIKAKELENQILQKKQQMEQSLTTQFEVLNLLPKYEELIRQQLNTQLQIEALKNRVAVAQQHIDAETKKLIENGLELLRLQRNVDIGKSIYILLRQEYEKARIAEAGELGTARVVNWAQEPEAPIRPKKTLNLLIAALVGLTLGTGLTFLRQYLDNTYKTPKEIEIDLGIPSLGAVFQIEHANGQTEGIRQHLLSELAERDVQSPVFNSYLGLETNLRFTAIDKSVKALLVTSSVPGEGKTTTALNLGLMLSFVGKKTLIVDTDLRKPQIAALFSLEEQGGLTDFLVGTHNLEQVLHQPYPEWKKLTDEELLAALRQSGLLTEREHAEVLRMCQRDKRPLETILTQEGFVSLPELEGALQHRREKLENFYVLPSGALPPNPATLLGGEQLHRLIEHLKEQFDWILLDSPPVTAVPDASVLSAKTDGVLLVIEAERTDREAVKQALEHLGKAGAKVLGTVLNKTRKPAPGGGYYGYYGYYGKAGDGAKKKKRAKAV